MDEIMALGDCSTFYSLILFYLSDPVSWFDPEFVIFFEF